MNSYEWHFDAFHCEQMTGLPAEHILVLCDVHAESWAANCNFHTHPIKRTIRRKDCGLKQFSSEGFCVACAVYISLLKGKSISVTEVGHGEEP